MIHSLARLIACAAILLLLSAGCDESRPAARPVPAITAEPSPAPRLADQAASRPATQTPTVRLATPTVYVATVTSTPIPTATPTVYIATVTPTPIPTATSTPTPPGPDNRAELVQGDRTLPLVALTFDVGWLADNVEEVLSILRAKQVRSTFFPTGEWTENNPELLRQIAADGHEVGNHSFAHPDYPQLSDEEIIADLARADEVISAITGRSTRPLFRFPAGARDARSQRVVNRAGYRSIYWTVESGDWRPELTGEDVYRRVMSTVGNGSIIVMHADSASAAESLDAIIDALHARGLGLLTVSALPE